MNIYVTDDIRKEWPGFEFKGRPFQLQGEKWIKCRQHSTSKTGYYCYGRNMVMMDDTAMLMRMGRKIDLI